MFVEIIFKMTPCSHFRLPKANFGKSIDWISTLPVPTYATPRLVAIKRLSSKFLRFALIEGPEFRTRFLRQYPVVSQSGADGVNAAPLAKQANRRVLLIDGSGARLKIGVRLE